MKNLIPQRASKLIIFLSYLTILTGCDASTSEHLKAYGTGLLTLPTGQEIQVIIAQTAAQQTRGLSKVASADFDESLGMLFPANHMSARQFWMPETHFDLDLFFMDANYYIIDVHRGLKHQSVMGRRSDVPMSKKVFSQHVLELKSGSPLSKKLEPGMLLKFKVK